MKSLSKNRGFYEIFIERIDGAANNTIVHYAY